MAEHVNPVYHFRTLYIDVTWLGSRLMAFSLFQQQWETTTLLCCRWLRILISVCSALHSELFHDLHHVTNAVVKGTATAINSH